jgi:hypothetical protein
MSLNSCDWYTSRTLNHASAPQKKAPARWLQISSGRRRRPSKRSSSSVTRMCSPRLSVWASARKLAAAMQ